MVSSDADKMYFCGVGPSAAINFVLFLGGVDLLSVVNLNTYFSSSSLFVLLSSSVKVLGAAIIRFDF